MKKLNIKKLFCFISILFISSCCIFYGTRFIKLYLENKKSLVQEENTLLKEIEDNNLKNDNFKDIGTSTYFINDANTNYLEYSNIIWRIVKINNDNEITIISDHSLTSLAFGENMSYEESYIYKWLNTNNKDYSGILEKNLNNKEYYLIKNSVCIDNIDKVSESSTCKNYSQESYVNLLTINDYINIGNKESYINNEEYFYLSTLNNDNQIWYINDEGKVSTSDGTDIIGIKATITLKANTPYISGDGTEENPYKIESESQMFGSYVKLDNQIWRIYQVNDDEVRLMLNDYLKVNNENLKYNYSNTSSYHDDYVQNSLAYYLNHDFYNTLSYKNKLKEVNWSNGYYGKKTDYDYEQALNTTINSKIALISIGDIRLNSSLTNYATLTGTDNKSQYIYAINSNQQTSYKNITKELNVVPVISIDKDLLTKGNGTKDSPYEME